MAIEQAYRALLIQEYILQELRKGQLLSAKALEDQITTLIDTKDLSVPQFIASDFHVERFTSSSASLYNNTLKTITQDLQVLYNELLNLTETSINVLERWTLETDTLERRLVNLEDRVDDLLLLAQDTEGYHTIVIDNFTDMSFVDKNETTAKVDLIANEVLLTPDNLSFGTRVFTNDLLESNVSFQVRNREGFVSQTYMPRSKITYPFYQDSRTWWTTVHFTRNVPVTCELVVRFDTEQTFSRIFMHLHDSAQAGLMSITPLYSTDNETWNQLPSTLYTQETRTKASFVFPPVTAKWVMFILTKTGPDPTHTSTTYDYQFGFRNISFYNEGFDTSLTQVLVSQPLACLDRDENVVPFSKMSLETCERLEPDTDITYEVTVSNNPAVPVDANTPWFFITPIQRALAEHGKILTVGDLTEISVGEDETIIPSHDAFAASGINPGSIFHVLSQTNGTLVDIEVSGISPRYRFINPDDRILNYQIKDVDYTGLSSDPLDVNEASIEILRNVGTKGLTPGTFASRVNGIARGWAFKDPWYTCVVEIKNSEGFNLGDLKNTVIYIDDKPYSGTSADFTVLSGKTDTNTGLHRIAVHKDNWAEVTPGANSIAELKLLDPLYPCNHKLLIEGYSYGNSFTENEIYQGVDLFAATYMKSVGLFDFLYNLKQDDFTVFTLDRDAPMTHEDDNESNRVILIKVNEENPDFQNERFVVRFKLLNDLRSYFRVRATLSTKTSTSSPVLEAYKFKLGH
jgi:hypothetical protein